MDGFCTACAGVWKSRSQDSDTGSSETDGSETDSSETDGSETDSSETDGSDTDDSEEERAKNKPMETNNNENVDEFAESNYNAFFSGSMRGDELFIATYFLGWWNAKPRSIAGPRAFRYLSASQRALFSRKALEAWKKMYEVSSNQQHVVDVIKYLLR